MKEPNEKPKPLSKDRLKSLENEDEIHNDHGSFIIGERDAEPQYEEDEEDNENEK